jgi:hypothetical protein
MTTGTWQVHALNGPYRAVGVSLFALGRSVVESPWYLLLFEAGDRAGAYLFTRLEQDPTRLVCHEGEQSGMGDLPARMLRAASMSDSTDELESVLRAECTLTSSDPSLAPISPRGAFGRPYDSLRGQWARAFVLAR